jgi:hypothetical protein
MQWACHGEILATSVVSRPTSPEIEWLEPDLWRPNNTAPFTVDCLGVATVGA